MGVASVEPAVLPQGKDRDGAENLVLIGILENFGLKYLGRNTDSILHFDEIAWTRYNYKEVFPLAD